MLVVTPNLCFDRTLYIDRFEAGTVARPSRVEVTAGGKGVNVSRTLRDLGRPNLLVGLIAERQGGELSDLLREEDANVRPVAVGGAVRSATIILERDRRATVLNEPGPTVGTDAQRDLCAAVVDEISRGSGRPLVACSGSLPPGLPADTYAMITRIVHDHGGTVLVDAAREALAATVEHGPDIVTPNLDEAEWLLAGSRTESSSLAQPVEQVRDRAERAAAALVARGARRAAVTAGAYGVALAAPDRSVWVPGHEVEVENPIGAGDSFVGGLMAGIANGLDWAGAATYAVAVAGAAVEQPRAGRVDPRRVDELAASTVGTS